MKKTVLLTALSSALLASAASAESTAPVPMTYGPALPAHVQALPAPAMDVNAIHARAAEDMQKMHERMSTEMARLRTDMQRVEAPAMPDFTSAPPTGAELEERFAERLAEVEAHFAEAEKAMAAAREDLLLDAPEMPERPEYAAGPRSAELDARYAQAEARYAEKRAAAEARFEQVRAELEARIAERRSARSI